MDETEIQARKQAKVGIHRILNELGDEMKAYGESKTLKPTHYAFARVYLAFCNLVSCCASDDPELVDGRLIEKACEIRAQWRELTRDA